MVTSLSHQHALVSISDLLMHTSRQGPLVDIVLRWSSRQIDTSDTLAEGTQNLNIEQNIRYKSSMMDMGGAGVQEFFFAHRDKGLRVGSRPSDHQTMRGDLTPSSR